MNKNNTVNFSPTPLHYTMFVLQQLADETLNQEVGISLSHARILGTLNSASPQSQRFIASFLHQTEANISRQIRVMADKGLVKIAPNSKDHRKREISRTSKGDNKFEQANKILKQQEAQFLQLIGFSSNKSFDEIALRIPTFIEKR
jgi:DNA-binding MarR family transcriptional regulator